MLIKRQRKLRNFIINGDLQFRVITGSLIFMMSAVLITLGLAVSPIVSNMFSTDAEIQYHAAQTFILLVKRLVPAVIILLLLHTVYLILITHKILGPLVNFSHSFSALKEGNFLRRVKLRPRDYLKDEGKKINEMIEGLSQLLLSAQENQRIFVADLEKAITGCKDPATKESFEKILKIILDDSRRVSESLSKFKVDNAAQTSKSRE